MSRCFPFPPPGYELKSSNRTDLPTKEKDKEKRHKKKDKEEGEHKERKDKDRRSNEKHGKRKDRKEGDKNRDKKRDEEWDKKDREKEKEKEKEKDRITEKGRASNERMIMSYESRNEGKLGDHNQHAKAIKKSKSADSLHRKIQDEEKGMEEQMFENVAGKVQNVIDQVQRKFDVVGRMARKGRGTEVEMVVSFTGSKQNVLDIHNMQVVGVTNNGVVGNPISAKERNSSSVGELLGKDAKKRSEGNEKTMHRMAAIEKGGTAKDKSQEEINNRKENQKDREKKKEKDKRREEVEPKDRGQKQKNIVIEQLGMLTSKPIVTLKDSKNVNNFNENHKRKDINNGVVHDTTIRPNKLFRPTSPSTLSVKNKRNLDFHDVVAPHTPDFHGSVDNMKVERMNIEAKINGKREPHPDSQYLSQIYSRPEMEKLTEIDDQQWLFGHDGDLRQKPNADFKAYQLPQVWAEALRVEEGDILALPYVIPY